MTWGAGAEAEVDGGVAWERWCGQGAEVEGRPAAAHELRPMLGVMLCARIGKLLCILCSARTWKSSLTIGTRRRRRGRLRL